MRSWGVVVALVISVGLASGAVAQQPAPQPGGPMGTGQPGMQGMPGQPGPGMGPGGQSGPGMGPGGQSGPGMGPGGMMMKRGGMEGRDGSRFDRPILSILLRHGEMFRLTPEQEQKLRALRAEYEKDAARGEADVRVAEIDLREMLAADAPDLSRVEAQVKKVAALQGELRFRRIRTLQAGLALLTKEQRQQLDHHLSQMGSMGMMGGGMGQGQPGPGMGMRQPAPQPGGAGTEHQH